MEMEGVRLGGKGKWEAGVNWYADGGEPWYLQYYSMN